MSATPSRTGSDMLKRVASLVAIAALGSALAVPGAEASAGRAESLKNDSFTVIAVVDSGINPYHEDFRRPDLTVHPSTYIEGFPRSTPSLNIDLHSGLPNAIAAREHDSDEWKRVGRNELMWIPGTNIIGAIGPFDEGENEEPVFDTYGHGTSTASLAGGMIHGPRSDRILIVAVKGLVDGLRWAAKQPWIDVITNSWASYLTIIGVGGAADASRAAVKAGKTVCFSSGNDSLPILHEPAAGPSWPLTIGAASAVTRGDHYYSNYPNDALGLSWVQAATRTSFDGSRIFNGTSASAPNACGVIAETLAEVRAAVGDTREGPHGKAVAVGNKQKGLLDDGRLTRAELEDAILSTAQPPATSAPDPNDYASIPAAPLISFWRDGYGVIDKQSGRDALKVVLGAAPRPDRTLEDLWYQATNDIRNAIWGNPPP